jgi:hypothetical protein
VRPAGGATGQRRAFDLFFGSPARAWASASTRIRSGSDTARRWVAYEGLRFGGHDRLGWSCQFDNDMDAPLEFGPLEDTQAHCNLFAFYTHDSGDAAFVPCLIDAKGP